MKDNPRIVQIHALHPTHTCNYSNRWRLKANVGKCAVMVFSVNKAVGGGVSIASLKC